MRNDILQQAQAIRASMDNAGTLLTDEQALENKMLYQLWAVGVTLAADARVRYGDKLYKVLQEHTTQENWTPDATPALYVEVAPAGEYREIRENMLPTEAFALNEIGWWQSEDNLYKSLIDANTYTPDSYPSGWEKVTG